MSLQSWPIYSSIILRSPIATSPSEILTVATRTRRLRAQRRRRRGLVQPVESFIDTSLSGLLRRTSCRASFLEMATSNPFHLRGDDAEDPSRQIAAAAVASPLKKGSAAAAQRQQQTQLASKPVPPAQADGKEKARG